MKKLALVLIIGLLLGTAAFADHQDTLGIGGIFGGSYGYNKDIAWNGIMGLSLKIPQLPVYWAFHANLFNGGNNAGFSVNADYYIIDSNLFARSMGDADGSYSFKLDWYLGAGLFTDTYFWNNGSAFDIGIRIPVGLSWHIIRELELFAAIGPAVGVYFGSENTYYGYYFGFGEIGLRYWFK